MIRTIIAFTAVAALLAAPAMAERMGPPAGAKPIYPLAKEAGLTTLVTAVKTAGLQGTLAAPGPYTVFAPTNEAFAALGEETLNAVLSDTELLTTILLYHVAAGELYASDVLSRSTITMLNGEDVTVNAGDAQVNNAGIAATDIKARNGVVHVIDTVLLPPSITSSSAKSGARALNTAPGSSTEASSWGAMKSLYR